MSERLPASLSLDFDNKWAYLRAAGHEDWESCRSYLPMVADRIVALLGEMHLPLTVFLVGRDLKEDSNVHAVDRFRQLCAHEYANHSLNHLPWMHTMSEQDIEREIATTHQAIREFTGAHSRGFRGPGFSCPDAVLRVLERLDYVYDASIFPTSVAPLARAAFLMRTNLKGEQKEKAKQLYGGFSAMRKPNRPFRRPPCCPTKLQNSLWEIPVTVMPLVRTPIHFSYFTYLAGFSTMAAKAYFRSAIRLCQWTGTPPSLLLHPPDFMGREDDSELSYLPGMQMSRTKKLSIVRWGLKLFAQSFEVTTMIQQVRKLDAAVDQRLASSESYSKREPVLSST